MAKNAKMRTLGEYLGALEARVSALEAQVAELTPKPVKATKKV